MLTTLIRAIGQLCHANHLAPELQPAPGPQPKPIEPKPATAPKAPTVHELEGLPLRYLIDTDTYGSGRDGEIVEVSYDATGKPARGISVKYCNLFDEKDTGAYGPYLKTSDTATEYHEGQIDPKGVGWTKNLTEQFARAVAQGFQYVELDNPDAYSVVDVLAAVSLAQRYGLKVIAKNPLLMPGDSTPYVAHPAVAGAIVERGAGSPADMDALRKKAGKTSLPVWFVAFGEGRAWAGNTANQAKQFGGMGVTYSSVGEYGDSIDLLRPGKPAAPVVSAPLSPGRQASTSNFARCVKLVLVHEGGNDDDPRDPGGRTSRGIIQTEWTEWRKTHPGLPSDVWQAPQDQVEAIYKQKYWDALSCDQIPAGVDYCVFDYGVNSGIGRAAQVLKACQPAAPKDLINKICNERLAFLKQLRTWSTFGRGWSTRVSDVRRDALAMVGALPPPVSLPSNEAIKTDKASSLLDPDRIVGWMKGHNCTAETAPKRVNLVYLEGVNPDGSRNDNRIDLWNDIRLIVQYVDGKPKVTFQCIATTEPGTYYDRTHVIGGPQGAALIAPGQQACWQVGIHDAGKSYGHEALVQTGAAVSVYRDFDKSFRRQAGHITTGWYGINQHSTGTADASLGSIGPWSAGCLVAPHMADHKEWMRILKTDERYLADHKFVFPTTVIPVEWQS
jgi:lysozyme family protein